MLYIAFKIYNSNIFKLNDFLDILPKTNIKSTKEPNLTEIFESRTSWDDVSLIAFRQLHGHTQADQTKIALFELDILRGAKVDHAENGKIAFEKVEGSEPYTYDIILMDVQMPVMNGYESAKAIRSLADKKKADIPIIAMTADAFSENVSECLAAGMNGHIAKPVDMKLVLKEIQKIKEEAQG